MADDAIDTPSPSPDDPVALFEEFLRTFEDQKGCFKYIDAIIKLIASGKRSLFVSFHDLQMFDVKLSGNIQENPIELLKKMNQALVNVLHEQSQQRIKLSDEYFVRFSDLPDIYRRNPGRIEDVDEFHLIVVSGMLVSASAIKQELVTGCYQCQDCGAEHVIDQREDQEDERKPRLCNVGGCHNNRRGGFDLIQHKSQNRNYQRVRIQQRPEEIEGGTVPRLMDCILRYDIIDSCKPGNRVDVIGVVKTVQKTGTRVRGQVMDVNNIISTNDVELLSISEADEKEIIALSKDPDLYSKIESSICPELHGYAEAKRGIAALAFGGVPLTLKTGQRFRGDIHILLCGDPGTGKTRLLRAASKLSTRSMCTTGGGVSSAGLTSAVLKDEFTGQYMLEAGILPLCDSGIAAIDEFGRMNKEDRGRIHDAMEGMQQVSIAKAGIKAELNARASVIASMNAKYDRWDDSLSWSENIDLDPAILSRFDLIYKFIDRPNATLDDAIATHISALHMEHPTLNETQKKAISGPINPVLLRKYIVYARREVCPVLTQRAADVLKKFYTEMRNKIKVDTSDTAKPLPLATRQYEGLIRISQAIARERLSKTVDDVDAKRAIDLLCDSLKQVCWDEISESYDINIINFGRSTSAVSKMTGVLKLVRDLCKEGGGTVDSDSIIERAGFAPLNMTADEVDGIIDELLNNASIVKVGYKKYKVA